MDYLKHYNLLIERARNRTLVGYTEGHHVIPKCMGGSDDPSNIVQLTASEHYVAHQLLHKMYPDNAKLLYACKMMAMNLAGERVNNKLYEWIRIKSNKSHSKSVKDAWAIKRGFEDSVDQMHCLWRMYVIEKKSVMTIRNILNCSAGLVTNNLNTYAVMYNKEDQLRAARFAEKSKNSKITRANITPEQEARRLRAVKSVVFSEEERKNRSKRISAINESRKHGFVYAKVECPHCGKSGGLNNMKRWHFDNCKEK